MERDGSPNGDEAWVLQVLSKAGPRLCEAPSRFRALEETLRRNERGSAREVLTECHRLFAGLSLPFDDVLGEIEQNLSSQQTRLDNQRAITQYLNRSVLTTPKVLDDFIETKEGLSPTNIESFIRVKTEEAEMAVVSLQDWIVCHNRVSMTRQSRRMFSCDAKVTEWSLESLPFRGSVRRKGVRRSSAMEAPVSLVDRLPRFVTSIPVRFSQRTLSYAGGPVGFMPFVPGMTPETRPEVKNTIFNTLVDYEWSAAAFDRCNELVLEHVSLEIVRVFGPGELVLAALSRAFRVPTRLVRRACMEAAHARCPSKETSIVGGENARDLFCPRCCVFDCKLHGIRQPVKQAVQAKESLLNRAAPSSASTRFIDDMRVDVEGILFPDDAKKADAFMRVLSGEKVNVDEFVRIPPSLDWRRKAVGASRPHPKPKKMRTWREPCSHTGPCGDPASQCSCLASKRYCERGCACDLGACDNAFPGCACSGSGCRDKRTCLCRKNGRECSRERCRCGTRCCTNAHLVSGARGAKMTVGVSSIHAGGLGTFAAEALPSGAFLGEYCGEIINDEEAEVRGFLYDNVTRVSFLFQLCPGSVVDSVRRGNKTKWINFAPDGDATRSSSESSSSDSDDSGSDSDFEFDRLGGRARKSKAKQRGRAPLQSEGTNNRPAKIARRTSGNGTVSSSSSNRVLANCRSSVVFVEGEPRICLFAKRDIAAGEELCFNYGRFSHRLSSGNGASQLPVRKTSSSG